MPTPPTARNWITLIALGLIWGGSFPAVTIALEGLSPVWIVTLRIVIGALSLWAIAFALGLRLSLPREVVPYATGMAVLSNALPFFLLSWSQQHVTSGFAGITMAAIPLFVIGLAHVFVQGEQLTGPKAAGFALGLVGVGVLIGPGVLASTGSAFESLAKIGCLSAALAYAMGSIVTRRCPDVHPVTFGLIALTIAAVMMLPLALALEGVPALPSARPMVAVIYLGLLPTGLATWLLVGIIRSAGPSFLSQVNYHVPVWSVLLGVGFLGEDLPGRFVVALVIILGGLMLARRKRGGARAVAP